MKSYNELVALSKIDIEVQNKDEVDCIDDWKVDPTQEVQKRLCKILHDIRNPYCFQCNDIIVKVAYANTETSIMNLLTSYLIRKKQV